MARLLYNPYPVLIVILILVFFVYHQQRKRVKLPDLPWINRDLGQVFSKYRARIWTTLHYKDAIHTAYHQVRAEVLIPRVLPLNVPVL